MFSVALSVASRKMRPGVTWQPTLWSPDFPRPAPACGRPVSRPSDRQRRGRNITPLPGIRAASRPCVVRRVVARACPGDDVQPLEGNLLARPLARPEPLGVVVQPPQSVIDLVKRLRVARGQAGVELLLHR